MKTQSNILLSSSLPPEPLVVAVPEESKDAQKVLSLHTQPSSSSKERDQVDQEDNADFKFALSVENPVRRTHSMKEQPAFGHNEESLS